MCQTHWLSVTKPAINNTLMVHERFKKPNKKACAKHTNILTVKGGARWCQVAQKSSDLHDAQNHNTRHFYKAPQSLLFYTYSSFHA